MRSSVEAALFRLGMIIEEAVLEPGSLVAMIITVSQKSRGRMVTLSSQKPARVNVIPAMGSNIRTAPREVNLKLSVKVANRSYCP